MFPGDCCIIVCMAVITEETKNKIAKLGKAYSLSLVVLFGSQATGKTLPHSDIDIAYFAQAPLSLAEESKFIIDLMRVCRTDAVDLVSLHSAPPLLRYQIARFGKVIYERTAGLFTSFYIHALRQYDEARPLFQLRSDYLDKKIARMNV